MKKLMILVLVALVAAVAVPALAGDGNLEWTATKDIFLEETFNYSETVEFQGLGTFEFSGEAWAKIEEQQEIYDNSYNVENGTAPAILQVDDANILTNIDSSYGTLVEGTASGAQNINQAAGSFNNQSNEMAISVAQNGILVEPDQGATAGIYQGVYCEAQVVTAQYNGIRFGPADPTDPFAPNERNMAPNTLETAGLNKADTINNSFAGFLGVADVNQAAGVFNNQGNGVAIAAGLMEDGAARSATVKAVSHVMLAQATAYNRVELQDASISATDTISGGTGNGMSGVFNSNQASGNMTNQKNVVALSFNVPPQ